VYTFFLNLKLLYSTCFWAAKWYYTQLRLGYFIFAYAVSFPWQPNQPWFLIRSAILCRNMADPI